MGTSRELPSYVANRDSTISGSRQGSYALHLWDRIGALDHTGLQRIAQEDEQMAQDIWIPTFEFINIIGKSIVANKRLVITEFGWND